MDTRKKLFIVLGVSLAVLLLFVLALFLFMGDGARNARDDAGDLTTRGASELDLDPASGDATGPDAEKIESSEGATTDEPEDEVERQPMLTGVVSGERGPIEGASVLLFAVPEIESVIRRLERLDPGSGIPDIPEVIATIKAELARFKGSSVGARSNEEGRYEFFDLPETGYFILALAPGHVFRYGDVVSLMKDRTQELDLFLETGAVISGRVVDSSERGMPGVVVVAEYRPPGMQGVGKIVQKLLGYVNGRFLRGPFEAVTDAEGAFRLDSLPPAVYDLLAEKQGYPDTRLDAVTTGTTEAVILLRPGTRIEGMLLDMASLPVGDVDVKLVPEMQLIMLPFPGASEIAQTVNRLVGDGEIVSRSRENGSFRFDNMGPGRYKLEVKSSGYLPVERKIEVLAGEPVLNVGVVRLDEGGVITGIVRAESGIPLEGARVSAFPEGVSFQNFGGAMNDMVSGRGQVSTDASGAFRVAGLASGTYRVVAQARGYGAEGERGVELGGEPLAFTLEPGVTISGVVLASATEAPLAGARVSASGVFTETDEGGQFVLEGVAPRGEFRDFNPFEGMRPGFAGGRRRARRSRTTPNAGEEPVEEPERPRRIRVQARATGYQQDREYVEVEGPKDDVVFKLELEPRISGIALDPSGEPLPGTLVRLVPDAEIPFIPAGTLFLDVGIARLDGTFVLDSPTEMGRFQVLASHPLYASTRSEAFSPGDHDPEKPIEVRLSPGATVRGVVTDGVNPIAGAQVMLSKSREEDARFRFVANLIGLPKDGDATLTSANGEFAYERILPGDYVLTAEVVGFGDTKTESFSLVVEEEKEIRIAMDPGGEIVGEVIDQNGAFISGAQIRVLREGLSDDMSRAQRFLGGAFKRARSDAEGLFGVPGLPSASYTLVAEMGGFSSSTIQGVRPGEKPVRITLVESAAVEGLVLDAAMNLAIGEFEYRVVPRGNGTGGSDDNDDFMSRFRDRRWFSSSGSDGRFQRDGLVAGAYRVDVRAVGFAPESLDISLSPGDRREITLTLATAGILIGKVVDAESGQPIAGARVGISRATAKSGQGDPRKAVASYFEEVAFGDSVTTDDGGLFELDSFPLEPQTVVASHDDYVPQHEDDVVVELGQERELTLRLRKGRAISGRVVDGTRSPVREGFVFASGVSEKVTRIRKGASPNRDGKFRIAGLESGTYSLTFSRRGGATVLQEVVIGEEDVTDVQMVVAGN